MALATVSGDGVPSCRIVLLRGASSGGFDFYTNYRSAKAGDLTDNSQAAATFWWPAMERQVRITGTVEKVDESVSDAYFASRPRGHKLSAWASPQSRPVAGRDELAALAEEAERRFQDDVPRPPHWGGYRLVPRAIEFWQGRENRLHDRLRYSRNAAGNWTITRLAP
jgi:pyridoxamine 5'-phosphate oxidase